MTRGATIYANLEKLYNEAPVIRFSEDNRIVIFSDLHLGDRSKKDDFFRNADLFSTVLRRYYLNKGFMLILNGDIEELSRFSLKKITSEWRDIYRLFSDFHSINGLVKIVGNHDNELLFLKKNTIPGSKLLRAIKLEYRWNPIFIFHGHQGSIFFEKYNLISNIFLRYLAKPLGIKNYSVSQDNMRRFKVEKRVYNFSSNKKIISIIGHTHRPLFESLSKVDSIKFKIEQLCRIYTSSEDSRKKDIERELDFYKKELKRIYEKDYKRGSKSSLYNSNLLIPCVFNSGTVIGKRGMTAIEIEGNAISLVHWFDSSRSDKHFSHNDQALERLENSDFYKLTIKKDTLDYIFTRIKLLS